MAIPRTRIEWLTSRWPVWKDIVWNRANGAIQAVWAAITNVDELAKWVNKEYPGVTTISIPNIPWWVWAIGACLILFGVAMERLHGAEAARRPRMSLAIWLGDRFAADTQTPNEILIMWRFRVVNRSEVTLENVRVLIDYIEPTVTCMVGHRFRVTDMDGHTEATRSIAPKGYQRFDGIAQTVNVNTKATSEFRMVYAVGVPNGTLPVGRYCLSVRVEADNSLPLVEKVWLWDKRELPPDNYRLVQATIEPPGPIDS